MKVPTPHLLEAKVSSQARSYGAEAEELQECIDVTRDDESILFHSSVQLGGCYHSPCNGLLEATTTTIIIIIGSTGQDNQELLVRSCPSRINRTTHHVYYQFMVDGMDFPCTVEYPR